MNNSKKIIATVIGISIIAYLTRKYWMPIRRSITVKEVDWDKKTAIATYTSGSIVDDRPITLNGGAERLMPTIHDDAFVVEYVNGKAILKIVKYKRGTRKEGELIAQTVIDFNKKEIIEYNLIKK